jgi:hypothetical protein
MIRRALSWPAFVFVLVFAWKVILFVLSAQPIPANDSFFYDGPVVNFLLHGRYVNPSLALAFPISGTQIFSAYPPLYQGVLLIWMKLFGCSACSAVAFQVLLFGLYELVVLAILVRLRTPVWCIHVGGAFLFLITFHDRPDGLAQLLGMSAVYCWVRSKTPDSEGLSTTVGAGWAAAMVTCSVLALCSSLQIGGIYLVVIWAGQVLGWRLSAERIRFAALACTIVFPTALILLVKFGRPDLFNGFLEHASQTPSLTGWRTPKFVELLKVIRNAPGVLAVTLILIWLGRQWWSGSRIAGEQSRFAVVALSCLLGALAVVVACLVILTPNIVGIANYLQPVIVGCCLAFVVGAIRIPRTIAMLRVVFLGLALFGSVRAIGMSTWGLTCALDMGYEASLNRVRAELASVPRGGTVVVSAAYLYEAARHDEFQWIHSDWLHKAGKGQPGESQALLELKPTRILLTQFDYFRRYDSILAEVKSHPDLVEVSIEQTARIPSPDSFRSIQKVVQHISWAPVVVTLKWKH